MSETDVTFEEVGAAGLLTLARPRQLNALNAGMVRRIAARLDAWLADPAITRIVLRAEGERAFCAGGDIRELHDLIGAGGVGEALAFWREEYELNRTLKRCPKPVVALIDGIVMGGGVGLAFHGSHRVAGERFLFAMPEVSIGFFPDVGATWLLPRLPGRIGTYLALTGARIGRDDGLALGLATSAAAGAAFPAIVEALGSGEDVDLVLARFATPTGPGALPAERPTIDRLFGAETLSEIMTAVDAASGTSPFAAAAQAAMRRNSPTSMAIALEQMRRGPALSFEEAMALEFRIVSRVGPGREFREGVRALIIDKDQAPRWEPPTISELDRTAVAAYFAPLGPGDLTFDARA